MSELMPIETVRLLPGKTTEIKGGSIMAANNSRRTAAVSIKKPQEKGLDFARFAMAIGSAPGNLPGALAIAESRYPANDNVIGIIKAAVSAGSTTNPTWAKPLVEYQNAAGEFVEYVRAETIIGKLGQGNVPGLRKIDFNVKVPKQINGGSAGWVREGAAKPVTSMAFETITIGHNKIAAITVLTDELLRFSSPNAELLVRDSLAQAVIATLDETFISPDVAAVEGVSPASVLWGVSPIASSGNDSEAIRTDVKRLFARYLQGHRNPTKSAVWIMPSEIAFALSLMTTPLGAPEFEGISLSGGVFFSLPVVVSDHIPADVVAIINTADIYLADDGEVTIDSSNQASILMDTAPTMSSVTPVATESVSMFQTNSTAFRAERYVSFEKARAGAAQYLTGVNWAAETVAS